MKILVVTDLYPIKDDEKTTPKTIQNFVKAWYELGHEIKIIKPNFLFNSFIRQKPFYKSSIYGNIENINYWLPFWGNIIDNVKTDLINWQPDVIVSHMPSGLIFSNKYLRLDGRDIPMVAGVHISDIEVLTNPIYSIYFKKELENAYKKAGKIACRSDILKQKFLQIFPEYEEKTFVGYSGLNLTEEFFIKKEWKKKGKYRIITCANLKKRKNVDLVIKACKNLDNVELSIIGDGVEKKRLKKLAGNADNILFKGYMDNKSVLKEMQESDIFILPSQNETFGMVYLEAMASGCITVGLKGDGIDGIIKDGDNGYLCEIDNIETILRRIIESDNQNLILENTYNTIKNYTNIQAGQNYINNITSLVID